MSISKIKENARIALTGKWGKVACISLAYFAFNLLLNFIMSLFKDKGIVVILLDIVSLLIAVPIAFGITIVGIKIKRNEDVKAFDFLNLGFSNFGRAWGIALSVIVKLLLPMLIMIIVGTGLGICAGMAEYTEMRETVMALIGLAIFVAYIVTFIWYLARSLLYSLTTYVAYDNPNMSSSEVVNESARIMKGNRGKYILLGLSFIGWVILGIITFGIGFLWITPYIEIAEICFYEHLLGKKEETNVDSNAEVVTEM